MPTAVTTIRTALAALLALGTVASAGAQADPGNRHQPRPVQRPQVIIIAPESLRGPPAPPERPYHPSAIRPPMERPAPLPPMSPRIGN